MITCPFCQSELNLTENQSHADQLVACDHCLNGAITKDSGGRIEATRIQNVELISELAPDGSVMGGVLGRLGDSIAELPMLPEVPRRILYMIHDPLTSMNDLAEIINEDPAISLRVMRISNSALYAGTHEIKDLHVACARLGMRTVANVVNAAANGNLYRGSKREYRSLMERLWSHAVVTAHCADKLATLIPKEEHRSAFVAGLVHDIGKLVLLDTITTRYKGNIGRLRDSTELLVKVLDRFHAIVGLHVVQYWKMPPEFAMTTYFADRPQFVPIQRWSSLAHIVSLASAMADACGSGVASEEPPPIAGHPSIEALGTTDEDAQKLVDEITEERESIFDVLGAA